MDLLTIIDYFNAKIILILYILFATNNGRESKSCIHWIQMYRIIDIYFTTISIWNLFTMAEPIKNLISRKYTTKSMMPLRIYLSLLHEYDKILVLQSTNHVYIYIYIYVCVCVCVCMRKRGERDTSVNKWICTSFPICSGQPEKSIHRSIGKSHILWNWSLSNDVHWRKNTASILGGSFGISWSCLQSSKIRRLNPTNVSKHVGRQTIALLDRSRCSKLKGQSSSKNISNDTHPAAYTSTTLGGSPRISRSCLHPSK
jgi:hypothetical protein